jgi:hypothetical protein
MTRSLLLPPKNLRDASGPAAQPNAAHRIAYGDKRCQDRWPSGQSRPGAPVRASDRAASWRFPAMGGLPRPLFTHSLEGVPDRSLPEHSFDPLAGPKLLSPASGLLRIRSSRCAPGPARRRAVTPSPTRAQRERLSRRRVPAQIAHGTETAVDDYRCPCAVCLEMNSIKRHRGNLRPARLRPDRQRFCLHLTIHPRPQRLRAPAGQSGHHPERRPPRTPANPKQDRALSPNPQTVADPTRCRESSIGQSPKLACGRDFGATRRD